MATIGGESVFSILDPIQLTDRELVEDHRAGVDGEDYQDVGIRGKTFPIRVIGNYLTPTARNAARISFRNMGINNSIITIVDDVGTAWTNLIVKSFHPTRIKNNGLSTGNRSVRMEFTMDLIATALSYSI